MKAFLSHSSVDKEFVRAIANELGRQFCVFDEQSFSTGKEFITSIEEGLSDSAIFVLIASRNALESLWVEFELHEAAYRKVQRQIDKTLVFIIDSSIEISGMPAWLLRGKIEKQVIPKLIAKKIRLHLDNLMRNQQFPYYVGRVASKQEAESRMMPTDGSSPPKIISIFGLRGIGRRTFALRLSNDLLNLERIQQIRIESGDLLKDLAIKLADIVEPYTTKEGLSFLIQKIRLESNEQTIERTINYLATLVQNSSMPVLVDDGGLLDESAYLAPFLEELIRNIPEDEDIYLTIISSRKPIIETVHGNNAIPIIRLDPLLNEDMRRLITTLSIKEKLKLNAGQISELSEYVAGFPPSAYHAVALSKEYGVDIVLADKSKLVEFRSTTFVRFLKNDIRLNEVERKILKILAVHSPLPIMVLGLSVGATFEDSFPDAIINLIDLALVVPDEHGNYSVSEPVREAIYGEVGRPSTEDNKIVCEKLDGFLAENTDASLDIFRVLFRVQRMLRFNYSDENAINLVSDIIRLTEELYHSQDYRHCISFAREALVDRPDNVKARSFLIRALIQEEEWKEAANEIEILKSDRKFRDAFYLEGFLARKMGKLPEAIAAYQRSIDYGRTDTPVYRDLAQCYFLLDDYENARKYIEIAGRETDNRFIVDLQIQIYLKEKDEERAREKLSILHNIDSQSYYLHRCSKVEYEFDNLKGAYEASIAAVNADSRPSFEMLAQLVNCAIEINEHSVALEYLKVLDDKYRRVKKDLRNGLRSKYEIAVKNYKDALDILNGLSDTGKPVIMAMRCEAIEGVLRENYIPDRDRISYQTELEQLKQELNHVSPTELRFYIDED